MSVILKGCNFEHTKLSIRFLSFNDESAIVKEAKDVREFLFSFDKIIHINILYDLLTSRNTLM